MAGAMTSTHVARLVDEMSFVRRTGLRWIIVCTIVATFVLIWYWRITPAMESKQNFAHNNVAPVVVESAPVLKKSLPEVKDYDVAAPKLAVGQADEGKSPATVLGTLNDRVLHAWTTPQPSSDLRFALQLSWCANIDGYINAGFRARDSVSKGAAQITEVLKDFQAQQRQCQSLTAETMQLRTAFARRAWDGGLPQAVLEYLDAVQFQIPSDEHARVVKDLETVVMAGDKVGLGILATHGQRWEVSAVDLEAYRLAYGRLADSHVQGWTFEWFKKHMPWLRHRVELSEADDSRAKAKAAQLFDACCTKN
jgi:hypothetical protein